MKLKGIALLTILLVFSFLTITPYAPIPKQIEKIIPKLLDSFGVNPSIVQSNFSSTPAGSSATTLKVELNSAINSGDRLIVGVSSGQPDSVFATISDTIGNSWSPHAFFEDCCTSSFSSSVYWFNATTSAATKDTITLSFSIAQGVQASVYEVANFGGLKNISGAGSTNCCQTHVSFTPATGGLVIVQATATCTANTLAFTTPASFTSLSGSVNLNAAGGKNSSAMGVYVAVWGGGTTTAAYNSATGSCPAAGTLQWAMQAMNFTAVNEDIVPVKASRTAGTIQQTIMVSGCSVSPTTYAGDGSVHNLVATPSCSLTNTLPAGFDWNTTGTRTWTFTTCASGTCATQSNTYTSHPIINQTTSCFFLAASSGTCTFSKVVSVGHDIVVGTVDSISSIGVTSVTDNGSAANTYHLIVSKSTQALAGDTEEWFAPVTSAATHIKVTVNWGSSINGGIILYDLAIASNDIPDDFSSGSALSTTTPTVTAYLPDANSMVIGVLNSACITTCTITAGPGGYVLDNNHGIGSTLQGSSESNRSVGASETTPFAASSGSAYNEVSLAVLFPGQTVSLTVALKLSITGLPTHSIPFYTINQTLPKERNNFTLYCDNAGVNTSTQLLTSSTSGITCDQATGVTITGKASLSNESIEWVFNNLTTFVRFEANPNSTAQSATYYYYCLFNETQYIENNPTGTLSYSTAPATSGSTDNPQISKKAEANGLITIWPRLGSNSTNFVVASTSTSSTTTTTATTTTTTFSNTTTTTTTSFTTTTFSNTTITSTTTTTTVHSNSTITNTLGPVQGYPTILDGIGIVAAIFLGAIVILRKKGEPPQT